MSRRSSPGWCGHDEAGPRLAPLYDLLSTDFWPELSPRMAMKIGRRSTLESVDIDGWRTFAADAGLGLPLVLRRAGEISAGVQARAGEVAGALTRPGIDSDVLTGLAEMVAGRAERCAQSARRRNR